MNPHTNESKQAGSAQVVLFLNQRFGYRLALEKVLAAQGFDAGAVEQLSLCARNRDMAGFDRLLASAAPAKRDSQST